MKNTRSNKKIQRVLDLVAGHASVIQVAAPSIDETTDIVTADVTFDTNLPNQWKANGESPSGVKSNEVLKFHFPSDFPLLPPSMSLRPDFPRTLPHLQPISINDQPVPCLYDGDIAEFFQQEGIIGIVNQISVWLERAALGTLIDPNQGWEPTRRDSLNGYVIAQDERLRRLVNRKGGFKFLQFNYLRSCAGDGPQAIHGQILDVSLKINDKTITNLYEYTIPVYRDIRLGASLALIVWPGKLPSGKLIINDAYLPETVTNSNELRERARIYGCIQGLDDGLGLLKNRLSKYSGLESFPLAIVFLVRRPFKIIGSQSPVELCPYVMDIRIPEPVKSNQVTTVSPVAHRHVITRSLLVKMSGYSTTSHRPRWTLIGAGSLGSKLGLHLTRAGNGPEVVIDKSVMSPHNAARHALIPIAGDLQLLWTDTKAQLLCDALQGFDHKARVISENVVNLLKSGAKAGHAWSKHSWGIVNATASLVVREALASTYLPTRIIETSLFADGLIGVITTEGPDRNPNTADLISECYALFGENTELANVVFGTNQSGLRQTIGQGCGSVTMQMSDGRLSLFAAGVSEYLLAKQQTSLPKDGGEILIGRLTEDGIGVTWCTHHNPPSTVMHTANGKAYRVHILARALKKIEKEISDWPKVETGGILMGRFSEVSNTFHVVDVLDPPEDSTRSAQKFVLGKKGLYQQITTYSETIDCSLYCLGTWHNHLTTSGPSQIDRLTAAAVSLTRFEPTLFLIKTPSDIRALVADAQGKIIGGQ